MNNNENVDKELEAMAQDPDIQREYEAIRREEMVATNRITEASGAWATTPGDIGVMMRRIEALEAENKKYREVLEKTARLIETPFPERLTFKSELVLVSGMIRRVGAWVYEALAESKP